MGRRIFSTAWWRGRRHALVPALGHLESEVMGVLWRGTGDLAVREVQARLGRSIAYTTVMTTLDRLYKKGLVDRRLEGRAFVYTARYARYELEAQLTGGLVGDLLAGGSAAQPLLSNLVDAVASRDDRLLDELERLVRDKREQIRREQG